jgi:tetratricopeptide (TPR) repeat protein
VVALTLMALFPAAAKAEWRSLRSEHFQLIGDAPARQLRDVALRFEQFRDIVTRLNLAQTHQGADSPLTILVFRDSRSFEPFMPRADGRTVEAAGMFVEGPDTVYIAVRLDGGEASFSRVFHEYTHLLLRSVFPDAPLWLHEGLAEYYSTLRITGERSALIGYPVAAHHRTLQQRAMPLTQLFAATDRSAEYTGETDARRLLYAQAWALVHHAFQSKPSRSSEILELAKRLAAGGAVEENVQALYGIPVAELERRVLGYIRNGSYTAVAISFQEELVNRVTAAAEPISDAEANGWLGDLLGQMGRDDEARPRLENALARESGLAQAHEALAMLLLRKDLVAEATAHLKEAQALGRNVDEVLRRTRSTAAPPAGFRQTASTAPAGPPPPPGARPSLRITLADEQRAFGRLEALECQGDQVEFVVRTADGAVRAGGRFVEISVTNYRQGSLGNMLCGPQATPLPTLLTWKQVGDARLALAVEFVPDGFVP